MSPKINLLVTGSNGQLGNEIREIAAAYSDYRFFFTDINELDITSNDQVKKFILTNKVNIIINCAGYTSVDKAESEIFQARLLNATAVQYLTLAANTANALFIHISTDYVFNGRTYVPYNEKSDVSPESQYGKTKLEGENIIKSLSNKAVIFRTSWLYSSFGHNFMKTIIKLGLEKNFLNVVVDQVGTPTYARDFALTLLNLLPEFMNLKGVKTYHYSNLGVCSWYDFACEITRLYSLKCKINPVLTKDYPNIAPRPHFSVLDKSLIEKECGIVIPYWKDSLDACITLLKNKQILSL